MNRRLKLCLIIGLVILLTLLTVRQSVMIYHNLRQIELTHYKSRHNGYWQAQWWMTVREIAHKHNIAEKDIFQALQIDPEPGDDKLSLRALRKKYNKSPDEMQSALRRLSEQKDPAGNQHE